MITENAFQIAFWLNKNLSAHIVKVVQNVGRTIPVGAYMCVVFMIMFFSPSWAGLSFNLVQISFCGSFLKTFFILVRIGDG